MTPRSAIVLLEERPMAGRVVEVAPGAVIGRDACDVVLPDPEVSRAHAVVRDDGHGPAIHDLGSLNGTFINGQRIEVPTPLRVGDRVQLGNTVFRVQPPSAAHRAG